MNINLAIRILALATMLVITGCTTVVEKKPATISTTTTEETTLVHPMRGASSTQTVTTESR